MSALCSQCERLATVGLLCTLCDLELEEELAGLNAWDVNEDYEMENHRDNYRYKTS